MSLIVDEHREYLADLPRVRAFERALRAVVRPGDVGLDLASGTGILGLLACRAGASRIYAIEAGDIATVARQIAHDNGFADRIVVVNEHSSRATLPERVDFVVTDMAGRFGFEAGLFELIRHARKKFMKPDARIIPRSVSLWVAPVESAAVRAQVDFWSGELHGFGFGAAHAIARATGYPRAFGPDDLLAEGARITDADLASDIVTMSGRAAFTVARAGSLDGIGGWFAAELAPGIELTNAPGRSDRINRRNVFFPLHEAVRVEAGDGVAVSMMIRPDSLVVRWRVEVTRGATLLHATDSSTFKGMLISKTNVERTRPDFVPQLSEAGQARRTVVDLVDGVRSVGEIEEAVYARHPTLFTNRDEATVFVAEVVTRYAL